MEQDLYYTVCEREGLQTLPESAIHSPMRPSCVPWPIGPRWGHRVAGGCEQARGDACAAAQIHDQAGGRCLFQAPTHQFRWIAGPRLTVEGGQADSVRWGAWGRVG